MRQKRGKRVKNKQKRRTEDIMDEGEVEFYERRGKSGGEEDD